MVSCCCYESLSLGAWWPEGRSSSSVSQFLPSCSWSACQMAVKSKDGYQGDLSPWWFFWRLIIVGNEAQNYSIISKFDKRSGAVRGHAVDDTTVYDIIRRLRETGEIFVRKGQDLCWMPVVFGPSDDTASLIGMILSLTLLNGPRNTSRNHCQ